MTRIAAISVYVDDMEKGVAFYRDVLGFGVGSRPVPFITELEHEGVALVLCQAEEPARGHYPKTSGVVLGIATADVAARAKELAKKGVDLIHTTPQEFPGGRFIALRDPAGNAVELLQFAG